jgi:signal transduction histidine kinase
MSFELDLVNIFVLIIALVNAIYGLLVYSRNRGHLTNLLFFFLVISLVLWQIAIVLYRNSFNHDSSLLLVRFLYFSAPLVPFVLLLFSFVFSDKNPALNFWQKFILPIPVVIVSLVALTPGLLIKDVIFVGGRENIIVFNELFYLYFGLHLSVYFIWSFINFILSYRKSVGVFKLQLSFIILGTLVASTIALITNYIFPMFGNFELQWVGQAGITLMIIPISYSILKYHLFNIKVISTEIFVFLLCFFILIRTVISETATDQMANGALFLASTFVGLLLIKAVINEVKTRERLEKLTKDLAVANEKLKELDELKTEFLSLASHQFRSPLTAIKGYSSLILEGSYGQVGPAVREAISNIFESSNNLAEVVQDFLDVSRIEQGRMNYDFEKIDLKEISHGIISELKPNISKAGLSINLNAPEENYFVSADKGKIKQVLINLIDNAQKYTKDGSINVKLIKNNGVVTTEVLDTGIGISKEDLPKLFGKFMRSKNANKVNVKGTGLGLYIVKKIIEDHKGKIWVESAGLGKGSKFSFQLREM